jgi:hypothetical protein
MSAAAAVLCHFPFVPQAAQGGQNEQKFAINVVNKIKL